MGRNKLLEIGIISFLLVSAFCSPAFCLTFSDEFDTLDAFWWTAQTTGTGATLSHSGGEIVMSQTAGTFGEANLVFNFRITGDYTAQVDYRLITWPADNDERIGLRATGIAVERISDSEFVTGAGEGYVTDDGQPMGLGVFATGYINDRSGKLRIVKVGNTISGYYWNGSGWTLIHSYSHSTDTPVLELSIWPQNLRADISVAFDNFYLDAPDTPDLRLKARIGVFRPGNGKWYLDVNDNGQWSGCGEDGCYPFGMNGDLAVAGDWNNDGFAEIGVFRPSTGMWYLDLNSNDAWSGCDTDSCIPFGMNGDLPVAGDWDNTGPSKVGVFRPSTGMWYLDYNGNGRWDGCGTDRCAHFGTSGDLPVSGDWNGSGSGKMGVFRPNTGIWYLDYNGNGQWDGCGIDRCINFGMSGDQPVAGDWNGSGTAKVGVFRPSTGRWYVDQNGNGQWEGCSVDACYYFGTTGDVAVTGVW